MSADVPAKPKGRRQPSALKPDDDGVQSRSRELLKVAEDKSTTAGSGDESLEGTRSTEGGDAMPECVLSPTNGDGPLSLTVQSGQSEDFSFGTTKPPALPPPTCLPKKELPPFREASAEKESAPIPAVVVTAHTRTPRLGKISPRMSARDRCDSGGNSDSEDPPEFTFGTTTPIQLPDFKQPLPRALPTLAATPDSGAAGQQLRHAAAHYTDEELVLASSPDVNLPQQHAVLSRVGTPQPHLPQPHQAQLSPYEAAAAVAMQNYAVQQQMHMQQQQEQMMQMHQEMQMQMHHHHHHQMQQHARLPSVVEDPSWRLSMEGSPLPTAVPPVPPPGYAASPSTDMASWSPYELQSLQASPMVHGEYYSHSAVAEEEVDCEDPEGNAMEAYLSTSRQEMTQAKKSDGIQVSFTCDARSIRRTVASSCICLLFGMLLVLAVVFFKDRG
eukprot:TRINITY_DN120763_c0_g1_i1.p1 TRINITY_DN120763_c0_g1~~TRINITY_DN120763_c0_g1_i1.p1  ORF type:complete len:443 (-),score=112.66 TRINITY_DN120763_c0_g1_i1:104-1432(-)